jgi:cell division protein FtsQ
MPLVDIKGLRDRLRQLPWVADARVSRQLPDTLVIDVVERKPHAVVRRADRLMLIDASGTELEPVSAARARGLMVLSGFDVENRVAPLDRLLDAAPALRPQVAEADWIGNRRWNLVFRSGQILELPEGEREAAGALVGFARLDGTNRLIGGRATAFDMRAPDRIYFRVPGHADADPAKGLTGMAPVIAAKKGAVSAGASASPHATPHAAPSRTALADARDDGGKLAAKLSHAPSTSHGESQRKAKAKPKGNDPIADAVRAAGHAGKHGRDDR